jgi:hypothetical protein
MKIHICLEDYEQITPMAKRTVLTLGQKKEIFDFNVLTRNEKPNSFLAAYFSEQFQLHITRNVIQRIVSRPDKYENIQPKDLIREFD